MSAPSKKRAGSRTMYMRCLNEMENRRIKGNVSLKLTQFGIDLSEEACRENVRELVCRGRQDSATSSASTWNRAITPIARSHIVRDLYAETGSCGAVIQAYLKRSESRHRRSEPPAHPRAPLQRRLSGAGNVAIKEKAEVDANFVKLARSC